MMRGRSVRTVVGAGEAGWNGSAFHVRPALLPAAATKVGDENACAFVCVTTEVGKHGDAWHRVWARVTYD